jgi:putative ABC transport system permease protein
MALFAWRNLLTRPARTLMAVIGLAIPIFGILGLFSLSRGIRDLFGDTLGQVHGLMVLRENVPTPIFSDLPAELAETIRRIPGVRTVAPEVWKIAPTIEGRSLFGRVALGYLSGSKEQQMRGFLDMVVIEGMDIAQHDRLRRAVFKKKLLPGRRGGRFLNESDRGQDHVVISTRIAADNPDPSGRPRRVGDMLRIGGREFTIVGMYETGSLVLDATLVMDIATARRLLGIKEGTVSSFMVEVDDPSQLETIAQAIQHALPEVDARNTSEFNLNIARIMGQLDRFLLLTVSLALVVGVVGIVNTMLMSTMERYGEFGVLRTNGWKRKHVLELVTIESALLGVMAGVLGIAVSLAGAAVANQFLGGGLRLSLSAELLLAGLALAVGMGTLGGFYPAWRASRLMPMEAIRRGTH